MSNLKCEKCSKKFSTPSNMLKHKRNMHSSEKEAALARLFEENSERKHPCSVCERFFTTNSNMNRYKRETHSANIQRLKCSQCPKSYATKENLKLHTADKHGCKQKTNRITKKNNSVTNHLQKDKSDRNIHTRSSKRIKNQRLVSTIACQSVQVPVLASEEVTRDGER